MKKQLEPVGLKDEGKGDKPQQYEIEDAANTLMRAEEIKRNKKLMPHVHRHLKKKKHIISSISELRASRQKMMSDDDQDD